MAVTRRERHPWLEEGSARSKIRKSEGGLKMEKTHEETYRELNEKFGVAWACDTPKLVGVTLNELAEKIKEDEHMNNIPLRSWDQLATHFMVVNPGHGLSLGEAVCMQKQAARDLVSMEVFNETHTG